MKKTFTYLSALMIFMLLGWQLTLNAQGTCATAVALVLDTNCGGAPGGPGANSGDPTGSDLTDGNVCSSLYSNGDDYIYEYTATTTDQLVLALWATNSWTGLLVTAGCPTTGTCFASATSSSTNKTLTTPAMTIGQTYYIHISTYPSPQSAGQFCLDASLQAPPTPPANDNCGGALPLAVNPDLSCTLTTPGTIAAATASPEDPSACFGTENDDVWFTFVATATSHQISLLNVTGSPTDLYHSLWEGTCGSLTHQGLCSDNNTSTASGLTIGNTYHLRVNSYATASGANTSFNVCIGTLPAPPANDDCGGAYPLTVNPDENCGAVTNGTVASATPSPESTTTCSGTEDDDVWFSFVATATTHTISLLNITGGTTDLYHSLWTGGCGSLVGTGLCSDPNSSTATGLTMGATYFLRVYSATATAGQTSVFDVCIGTPPPPPANDLCAGAIPITPSAEGTGCGTATFNLPFSTDGTTDSGVPTVCSSPGLDQWFTWTATAPGLTFNSDSPGDPGIAIFASCADAAAGNDIACLGTFGDGTLTGWSIGDPLIIQIYDFNGSNSNVAFCLETYTPPAPPVNDACAGAINIVAGGTATGSTTLATNVEGLSACSGGGGGATGCIGGAGTIDFGAGVWFSYTSTGAEVITADTDGSSFDTEIQVFEGSCGALTCVGGDDDSGVTGLNASICWVSSASFAPVTYYIYVDGDGTSTGAFVLNISVAPLPITLISFEGEKLEKANRLSWVTASEENTEMHVIERSVDGNRWEKIGAVAAQGFSYENKSYAFVDEAPTAKSYYRLKSVDFDGSAQYSNVVILERASHSFSLVSAYPVPVRGELNVAFNNDRNEEVLVVITDLTGRTIHSEAFLAADGGNVYQTDMSGFASGVYFVSLSNQTTRLTQRIVKN